MSSCPMIPQLEHHCGSWIVSCKDTGKAVLESFSRDVVSRINQERYRVETAAQYLSRFNRQLSS